MILRKAMSRFATEQRSAPPERRISPCLRVSVAEFRSGLALCGRSPLARPEHQRRATRYILSAPLTATVASWTFGLSHRYHETKRLRDRNRFSTWQSCQIPRPLEAVRRLTALVAVSSHWIPIAPRRP